MKRQSFIYFFVLILFLSACGPVVIPPPTATPSPTPVISGVLEFFVSSIYLGMQGVPGQGNGCVSNYSPFEIRATIQNASDTTAYNVSVIEHGTGTTLMIGELGPWQSFELVFPAASSNGSYVVEVDPGNTIPEIDEYNNSLSYLAPTPTPPVLCTPTPTPALSTPIASFTPILSTQPLAIWQSLSSPCRTASFWADHMTYGFCGGDSITLTPQIAEYSSRYTIWTQAYAPFTADTPAGSIIFNGAGYVIATEAERRMIAEWAARMSEEVPGQSMLADRIVLSSRVSAPDRCFDVTLYRDGLYLVFSCMPGPGTAGVTGYLDANELFYFYRWLDSYQAYQGDTEDTKIYFLGQGPRILKIAEIVSMRTMLSNIGERTLGYTSGGGYPSGALAAQKLISIQLGIPIDQVQIQSVESVDYPDSCLGAPRTAEVCAPGVTPGLRIYFAALGMIHEFHTDPAGYDLRLIGSVPPTPPG